MRFSRLLLLTVFSLVGLASNHASAIVLADARFDYGSIFQEELHLSATNMFSDHIGAFSEVTTFPRVNSLFVEIGPLFAYCGLIIAPGVGFTFGPKSWNFVADKTLMLGRDIAPYLYLHYHDDLFEAEALAEFFFPLQESASTAIEFGVMRVWGAIKWKNYGIGPFTYPLFTRNSGGSLIASHVPVGAVVIANYEKVTFRLFLGHDPISLTNWLGAPKASQPYFKAMVIYHF
jgi:hypothetical protein